MSPDTRLMLDALAARVADIRRNIEEQQRAFADVSLQLYILTCSRPEDPTVLGGATMMTRVALAGAVENFRVLDEKCGEFRAAQASVTEEGEPS